jgi:predicted Zn finger-like uncharacterized protein
MSSCRCGNQRTELFALQRDASAICHYDCGVGRDRDLSIAVVREAVRATSVGGIAHVRSDHWPKWACRRAPAKDGALLERWRAQCGKTPSHYTPIDAAAYSTPLSRGDVYCVRHAFLSPVASPASSPHQSTFPGALVTDFRPIPPTVVVAAVKPASCPVCRSSTIVTTAKIPDAHSDWRCANCGEIWNVSRVADQATRWEPVALRR